MLYQLLRNALFFSSLRRQKIHTPADQPTDPRAYTHTHTDSNPVTSASHRCQSSPQCYGHTARARVCASGSVCVRVCVCVCAHVCACVRVHVSVRPGVGTGARPATNPTTWCSRETRASLERSGLAVSESLCAVRGGGRSSVPHPGRRAWARPSKRRASRRSARTGARARWPSEGPAWTACRRTGPLAPG